ncbi:hypothetical protein WSK_1173 [Novosphingobium sp. Rr 2-17]|uniref:hypothetical protein n=1 Tax=Novosphingobium sp. Rr 2-17 TaxID=555793 RepID=UPI000269A7D3|nr:hypothetical protein [Novosphingobium sp. Rr 2-17]EIZ80140.1 hypothetical protein WSK_1173 [Novosphingobium sp. Rr 2-17]
MSMSARQMMSDRAARDVAKAEFDAQYALIKADLQERGLAGRIADEAVEQARTIFDEAVAVVEEHPGVVGGTLAALVLWLFRNPIIAWVQKTMGSASR